MKKIKFGNYIPYALIASIGYLAFNAPSMLIGCVTVIYMIALFDEFRNKK